MWLPFAQMNRQPPQQRMRAAFHGAGLSTSGLEWSSAAGQLVGGFQQLRGLGFTPPVIDRTTTALAPPLAPTPSFTDSSALTSRENTTFTPTATTMDRSSASVPAPVAPTQATTSAGEAVTERGSYSDARNEADADNWARAREEADLDYRRALAEQEHRNKGVPEANTLGPDNERLIRRKPLLPPTAAPPATGGGSYLPPRGLVESFHEAPLQTKAVVVTGAATVGYVLLKLLKVIT